MVKVSRNGIRRFNLVLIAIIYVATTTLSLFMSPAPNASAQGDNYEYESNAQDKLKAAAYWWALNQCKDVIKETITGSDITKGPQGWIGDGDNVNKKTNSIALPLFADVWGNKDGRANCNGESDNEPGWIGDVFNFFRLPIGDSAEDKRTFLINVLGYVCTLNGSYTTEYTCKNVDSNDPSKDNSWSKRILKLSSYLNNYDPVNDKDAMLYLAARTNLDVCAKKETGNSNMHQVMIVQASNGKVSTETWTTQGNSATSGYDYIRQNKGNDGEVAAMGCPDNNVIVQGDDAKYTEAYRNWLAKVACYSLKSEYNSDYIAQCQQGWLNSDSVSFCVNNYVGGPDGFKACAVGQNQPVLGDGNRAGVSCRAKYYKKSDIAGSYVPAGYVNTTINDVIVCTAGAISHANGNGSYCAYSYNSSIGVTGGNYEVCSIGYGLGATNVQASSPIGVDTPPPPATSTCAIEGGLGWIICPIADLMSKINDNVYSLIDGLLSAKSSTVATTVTNNGSTVENGTYTAWKVMRNLANAGFVIAFLVIIFSQITSIGISNYGLKKLMPRLIIAAILVNLSYFVAQAAVDLSNILGGGLKNLISGSVTIDPTAFSEPTGKILGGTLILTAGVATTIAAAALISGAVGLLIPVLLATVLSLLVTIAILVTRNVLVILLVVVSPLAFLAMLLPNTNNLFKQWRKMFTAMLTLYPMVAVLFGASALASKIILGDSNTATGLDKIIGLLILAVPLALTPTLLKGSLNAIPMLGNLATKLQTGANSRLKKSTQPFIDKQKSRADAGLTMFGRQRVKRKFGLVGSVKKDASGIPIGKNRTLNQVIGDSRRNVEKEVSTNKTRAESGWAERGLEGNSFGARRAGKLLDEEKNVSLQKQAVDKQYDARLEVRKLTDTKVMKSYDKLQDAGTVIHSLEQEQKTRQLDRINNNAVNTVARATGQSKLQSVNASEGLNISHDQAQRLQTLSNISNVGITGGGGLKILHETQESAELKGQNIDAAMKDEFEQSKLPGGINSGLAAESIAGKVASEMTKAKQDKVENEARYGTNQEDIGNKNGENTFFTADQLEGIKTADRETQAEKQASDWAKGGSSIEYASEINSGSELGKQLAVTASGAKYRDAATGAIQNEQYTDPDTGEVRSRPKVNILVYAKAAKAVLEDAQGDENTIVTFAKSTNLPNSGALAILGIDKDGKKLDGGPQFADPENFEKEERGYLRYIAGRGDKASTMAGLTYVGNLGDANREAVAKVIKYRLDSRNPKPSDEEVKAYDRVRKAQSAFQESAGSSMPPWTGGTDQQGMAEGTYTLSNREGAIASLAGGKLSGQAFSGMGIDNKVALAKILETVSEPEIKTVLDKVARNAADFENADYDIKRKQLESSWRANFAGSSENITRATENPQLNQHLEERDKQQFEIMQKNIERLTGKATSSQSPDTESSPEQASYEVEMPQPPSDAVPPPPPGDRYNPFSG